MYFRLLSEGDSTRPILELSTKDGNTYKIQRLGEAPNVEEIVREVLTESYDETDEEREATVAKMMRRLAPPKWKLWGTSTRVLNFDSLQEVVLHFGEFYFKKLDSFKNPEFICTDSKGNYVATIRANEKAWDILDSLESPPKATCDELDEAMRYILTSTDI